MHRRTQFQQLNWHGSKERMLLKAISTSQWMVISSATMIERAPFNWSIAWEVDFQE